MPKAKRSRGSSGGATATSVPLAEQIAQSDSVKPITRVKRRDQAGKHGGGEEDDEYVDEKLSRRILRQARIQQDELEAEHGVGSGHEPRKKTTVLGPTSKDGDSDAEDEWPELGAAGAMEKEEYCEEMTVNPDDEKAIDMFMSKNPPVRQIRRREQLREAGAVAATYLGIRGTRAHSKVASAGNRRSRGRLSCTMWSRGSQRSLLQLCLARAASTSRRKLRGYREAAHTSAAVQHHTWSSSGTVSTAWRSEECKMVDADPEDAGGPSTSSSALSLENQHSRPTASSRRTKAAQSVADPLNTDSYMAKLPKSFRLLISQAISDGIVMGLGEKPTPAGEDIHEAPQSYQAQPELQVLQAHRSASSLASEESLTGDKAQRDLDLSDDKALVSDPPAFKAVFSPALFKTLLHKARTTSKLGVGTTTTVGT